jgi:hypothetical protein
MTSASPPLGGRLRIVVTGLLAQYSLGGVAWDYLQYLVGLQRLGHDVYYLEDTGAWPYNPIDDAVSRRVVTTTSSTWQC